MLHTQNVLVRKKDDCNHKFLCLKYNSEYFSLFCSKPFNFKEIEQSKQKNLPWIYFSVIQVSSQKHTNIF